MSPLAMQRAQRLLARDVRSGVADHDVAALVAGCDEAVTAEALGDGVASRIRSAVLREAAVMMNAAAIRSVPREEMDKARAASDAMVDALSGDERVVILGGPRTGKSTIAVRAGERYKIPVRHADSLVGTHEWGDDSAQVASWLDEPAPWIVEGVSAVRALRKWLAAHPDSEPMTTVMWLSLPVQVQSRGQETMHKGVRTVWNEIAPDLRSRGFKVIERD